MRDNVNACRISSDLSCLLDTRWQQCSLCARTDESRLDASTRCVKLFVIVFMPAKFDIDPHEHQRDNCKEDSKATNNHPTASTPGKGMVADVSACATVVSVMSVTWESAAQPSMYYVKATVRTQATQAAHPATCGSTNVPSSKNDVLSSNSCRPKRLGVPSSTRVYSPIRAAVVSQATCEMSWALCGFLQHCTPRNRILIL